MSKSRISLEASELNEAETDWVEASIFIEREDEPDEELRCQLLVMTRAELDALYHRMKTHYEQGIWSTGSVQR